MPLTFNQGADRWRKVRLGLAGEIKTELDRFRQKTVAYQLSRMIDAPQEHEWRYGDDPRPLRIIRARLWLSLRGPQMLDADIARGSALPSKNRRYPRTEGGVSEHYKKIDITRTAFSTKGTITFGTATPYAPVLEKHRKRRFATFYPGIKDAWEAEHSLINITEYILRKLKTGL